MANEQNLKPFTGADDPRRGTKPKGTIHLSTHIQNMLNDEDFTAEMIDAQGKRLKFKGHPVKAIIKTAILKAQGGDKQWADWIAQNGYGSKLSLEVTDARKEILERYGLPYAGQAEAVEDRPPQDTA